MDFGSPPRRPRAESVVPMINVVFLLLVFFLMTATIAPPDPVGATPPEAGPSGPVDRSPTLHIGADGALAFGTERGEAALAAVPPGSVLTVRADAGLPGTELARVIARLAEAGVTEVRLVTVRR